MARTGGKRNAKSTGSQAATSSKLTSTPAAATNDTSSDSSIPHPFQPLSPALRNFAATLPTDHVYVVYVDRTPIALKRQVFMVPVFLNIVLSAALAVRIYFAAPAYLQLIITTFGYETSWSVQPSDMGMGDLMGTITGRTMLLMMDYCLFGLLGRWPWEFVMGDRKYGRGTGALEWRWTLGFQNQEIVVRKGRKWDDDLTALDAKKEKEGYRVREGKPGKSWSKEEELSVQMKVEQALSRTYTQKTGYLLLDKEWDLDFRGMIDAQKLFEKKKLKMEDLDNVALVNVAGQWSMWYPHGEEVINGYAAKEEEEDRKVQVFRQQLAQMGCENVFFRWIEMVQYETSQPGGFSEKKKTEAVNELERMIDERGQKVENLWQAIGGVNGLPGFEEAG